MRAQLTGLLEALAKSDGEVGTSARETLETQRKADEPKKMGGSPTWAITKGFGLAA